MKPKSKLKMQVRQTKANKEQLEALLVAVEANLHVPSEYTVTDGQKADSYMWETIALKCNQLGLPKTARQWKRVFTDLKARARKKDSIIRKNLKSGKPVDDITSEMNERVLQIMKMERDQVQPNNKMPTHSSTSKKKVEPSTKKQRECDEAITPDVFVLSEKIFEKFDEIQNEIPTIAKVWGAQLNVLEEKQRIFAEKAINDILFEARLGCLHRHSFRINEPTKEGVTIKRFTCKKT